LCERYFHVKHKTTDVQWKDLYKSRIPLLKGIQTLQLAGEDICTDLVVLDSPCTLRYIGHDAEGNKTVGISFIKFSISFNLK